MVDRAVGLVGRRHALLHRGNQLVAIELGALAAGADEAVAGAAGVLGDLRTARGDVDRHGLVRPVVDRGVLRLVELTLEADVLLRPQLAHQHDRLAHAGIAFLELGPGLAGRRHLVQRFARADTQDDASGEQAAQGGKGLRHDRRVIAIGRRQHAGAHDDLRGAGAHRAHPGDRVRRMAALVAPRLEVIADEHRVEPDPFGLDGETQQFPGSELFGGRLVAQLQH